MALPEGKHCYTRPDRTEPRRFTAMDCGRIVAYAKAAGESDEAICEAIAVRGGLECGDCDCERIKQLIEVTLGVIALVAAVRLRNRQAMKQALEAIAKAQRSSKQAMGRIELERVESYLASIEKSDAELDDSLDRLTQLLQDANNSAFSAGAKDAEVIIRP